MPSTRKDKSKELAVPDEIRSKARRFLKNYAEFGIIHKACDVSGLSSSCLSRLRKRDPDFLEAFKRAREAAADKLEAEAYRRAVEGYDRPIYQKGEKVGVEKVYSDRLLEIMLRANKPEKFSPAQRTELSGPDGAPISVIGSVGVDGLKDRLQNIIDTQHQARDLVEQPETKRLPESQTE